MANIPLTEDQVGKWLSELKAGEALRKKYEKWWESSTQNYGPSPDTDPEKFGANINTNRDFTLVEQKKAQLFFQSPEVSVKASPLMVGNEDVLIAHEHILNEYLGPDRLCAIGMMEEAIHDIETCGFGVTKMGYESITVNVKQPQPVPDPTTGAPATDPLTGEPITVEVDVPVPIKEELFWRRVSPMKVILPATFKDRNYDNAPWMATKFRLSKNEMRLYYNLDVEAKAGADEDRLSKDREGADDTDDKAVEGYEVWYRACLYDEKTKHPDLLRCLVLVEGREEPIKHVDSPYQSFDELGRMTPDSLVGFPIHIFAARHQPDSAYVMADTAISRPQVNELNKFREQQIQMRDSNIPIRIAHPDIPDEVLDKFRQADYRTAPIKIPSEAWNATAGDPIKEIAKATYPRENFTFEEKQDADIARTHAMDANQSGVQAETQRTATELQLVQTNANVRLDAERQRIIRQYVRGVTKFSALLQRFLTVEKAAEIVGPEKAQAWAQTMKQIPAALAFTCAPDSALRQDAAQERKVSIESYQFLANDPMINRQELLKQLLPKMKLTTAVLAQPQPPQPELPKVSLSIKSESLSPLMPEYPGVLAVLKAAGLDVSQLPQPAQPENPGAVQPETGMGGAGDGDSGGMQGTGAPAPIAPGGMLQ